MLRKLKQLSMFLMVISIAVGGGSRSPLALIHDAPSGHGAEVFGHRASAHAHMHAGHTHDGQPVTHGMDDACVETSCDAPDRDHVFCAHCHAHSCGSPMIADGLSLTSLALRPLRAAEISHASLRFGELAHPPRRPPRLTV